MRRESLLQAALNAADRGWHVFPLRPNDKRPAYPDHGEGACTGRDHRCRTAGRHVGWEARATTDPDRIRRCWSAGLYNVGIACGPSGLVVVDLDQSQAGAVRPEAWRIDGVHDGGDVLAVLAERAGKPLPFDTHTVTTGRGGVHLYYRHPAGPALRNTAGTVGWLVDTRAHGGYVVAAGSVVNGRSYVTTCDGSVAVLPGWLADAAAPAPLPAQKPVTVDLTTHRLGRYVAAAVRAECDRVTGAPVGTRNRALYVASVALGQLAAGGSVTEHEITGLLTQAALAAGLRPGETAATIASGLRAGTARPREVA